MKSRKLIKKIVVFTLFPVILFGLFYFIDGRKPKKIEGFWSRYPQLDRLYSLTKITDFLNPGWFFYPAPYCYFQKLMPENKTLKKWCGVYKSKLPFYELTIDKQEAQKMEASLPPAYSLNFYLKKDYYWAPAKFLYEGKEYPVKVRIRGDLYNHWSGKKKSYRVEFTDEFQDFPELNFVIPEDRGFFVESLANFRAEKLNLFHLESWFAILKINGSNQGVYLVQEHWNEEFLERNRRNSLGALYGEQDLREGFYWPQLFSGITAWKKYNKQGGVRENYDDLDYLLSLVNKEKTGEEEFKREIFKILDQGNFFSWQVHAMISSSYHQDWGHNLRLYFNQDSGKFEFVPFDLSLTFDYRKEADFYPIDFDYNPLVTRILLVPEFRLERDWRLYQYVKENTNLESDLIFWQELFNKLRLEIFKDRNKAFSNNYFLNQEEKYRQHLENHFINIKKLLEHNDLRVRFLKSSQGVMLEVVNEASSPVKIQEISLFDSQGKRVLNKKLDLEIFSDREIKPKEENESYGLIKVVPHTEEILLEMESEIMEEIDFTKTQVKAVNLVSEKEVGNKEIRFL